MLFLWRCTNWHCDRLPYFGFVTTRTYKRPTAEESKWLNGDCVHVFQKQYNAHLKRYKLPRLTCFGMIAQYFNKRGVVIKSKYLDFRDINRNFQGFNISVDGEHRFVENVGELASFTEPNVNDDIADECYLNYHQGKQKLIQMDAFRGKFTDCDWRLVHIVVCMLCEQIIPKKTVIAHLNKCFGLEFQCTDPLPAYKLNVEYDL